MTQLYLLPPKWLRFPLIILLVLGIFFRFANFEQKPYWHDEIYTSLRVSGYNAETATRQLYKGQEISIKDLHKYQITSPEKNAIDTIKGLAQEEPQHPPLYYVIARFWAEGFGSSVRVMRLLPVLISLFVFPCLYWLCLELFEESLVGWVAVALVAVSPLFIRYAQEARQYSLWSVMILLSSAALLRAMRRPTLLNWSFYAATAALSLYTHLFSGLVLMGHGVYVFVSGRFRLSKTFIAYLLAASAGLLLFTPWLKLIVANKQMFSATTDWTKFPLPFLTLLQAWSLNLCRLFISWHPDYNPALIFFVIPIFLLVAYAIYFLCRQSSQRVWLFILTLIGVTASALLVPDLLLGGRRSSVDRYLFPAYLGIQLAVAYLLARKITYSSTSNRKLQLWRIVTTVLISGAVLSCAINSQAETWWRWSEFDVEISRIINQSPHALVISDAPLGGVMPLSHRLNSQVRFLLVHEKLPNISKGFSHVFLFNPSEKLRSNIELEYRLKSVYKFRENTLVVPLFCVDQLGNLPCSQESSSTSRI